MKHIALFLSLFVTVMSASAQIKNYEADWKKVDALWQQQRLPKSALAEVNRIFAKAKKEKQEAQVIKALVYRSGLQQQIREANTQQSISEVEAEIKQHGGAAQAILQSMLAGLYWNYLQQNRWKFYDRTNTVSFKKEDISTWTPEDLHRRISELYLASLRNEKLLQQTSLAPYEAIISKGNVRHLRPTLYDLLAHRALEYFRNDERDISKPAYAFEVNQPQAFAPATRFAAFNFSTKDSLLLHHKALTIYQELIRLHQNDNKKDALLDVDVARLSFVQEHSIHPNKDSLYEAALKQLLQQYGYNTATYQAAYLLAAHYRQQGEGYQPFGDTTHRYKKAEAKALLEKVVKDSSDKKNEGWVNSFNLLQQIAKPAFSFELERVNLPAQPFRALVKYTNLPLLHVRIIKATEELKKAMENEDGESKYWAGITRAAALKSWQQTLPPNNDYQEHSAEIKIEALPAGEYFLLAAAAPDFNKDKTQLGGQFFHVSNISYINQGRDYFVLHRESGQPLAKAAVMVFTRDYDYKTSRYTQQKGGVFTTNEKGYVRIALPKNEQRRDAYFLDISHNAERLKLDDYNYDYYDSESEGREIKQPTRIFFFTDRSIYRPGQTVYFKGIAVNGSRENNSIATGYKTKIFLRNANYQLTDSLELTTNDYGSFNGKFTLPQNVLNGYFSLTDQRSNEVSFSVEEYKRPKFAVDFEKIKESYKAGDSVTVIGTAKAYAGNNIDGAKVVYRVVRQPRFLYPWLFWRGWFPPSEPMEIAHGEATTNKDGQFTIRFQAIPDLKLDKKWDPVFDYEVHADVTDINGETRSGETTVRAGYKSLVLKVQLPERMLKDSLKAISIVTQNMNGVFQPSAVTVTFTKLIPENRLIRKRYWQQPDQFVLSKEAFIAAFPHDEYRNESDPKTWAKGEVALVLRDSSEESSKFKVQSSQLGAGQYEVTVVTKDEDGQEVKDVRYIELFDEAQPFATPAYLRAMGSEGAVEPGQATRVQIATSAADVFLIGQVDKRKRFAQTGEALRKEAETFSFTGLNREQKTFTYIPTEEDRGGFGVSYFFVKDNRFYQFSDVITVPWSNKELKIDFATFRDKTLPGSEEKWKVKISGAKGDAVAAEMLASMYDASLDQFKPHGWNVPGLWPVYYNYHQWNERLNFSQRSSQRNYVEKANYNFDKHYDRLLLNSLETDLRRGVGAYIRGRIQSAPVMEDEYKVFERVEMSVSSNDINPYRGNKYVMPSAAQKDGDGIPDTIGTYDPYDIDIKLKTGKGASIQPRRNFNETAFFFPDLKTDAQGNIEFSFTTPEALTKWKLQTLAHTKDLAFGLSQKELITQKELMVQPNAPRFLRQGDAMEFPVKVVNLTDKEITGQVQLELFDAATNQSVDGWFMNTFPNQYFTVAAGSSEVANFPIQVPYQFTSTLTWRVTARAKLTPPPGEPEGARAGGEVSDGEENILPVLTNKILVTETLPLPMKTAGTKTFSFDKLKQSGNSETLQHQSLTVEYTSNPAWLAVQALPYLMEYPYDCAEQTWNRYYANALAAKILRSAPRIKTIFERWKTTDTAALISNLQKNEELKSALLEETPWVLQAQSETQQKKNIALLFDLVRMGREQKAALAKLQDLQAPNGGFVWFKGGPDDRYITQYIISSIGHLKKLGGDVSGLSTIINKALPYLDKKIANDYSRLLKSKADLRKQQPDYTAIQYLYMRSFFPEYKMDASVQKAAGYYRTQAQQFWTKQGLYVQGMMALALHRNGDGKTAQAIIRSLKETSVNHEELGRYWISNSFGKSWYWHQAPIETQALMIEAFSDISNDKTTVRELHTWLLKNKQTTNWRTTKATADACYALLLQGNDWLANEPAVRIQLGNAVVTNSQGAEAGTGYIKQSIPAKNIAPEMGNIVVTVQPQTPNATLRQAQGDNLPSWGAVYWQYFEDMDKVTTAATPLQLQKKLFIQKNTDRGPVLAPVAESSELHIGDKVVVRIELRVDRDMEYVHMKDLRASSLEPVNVLSGYKWQGGLGYYETTKDASTNFFFNYLRKGTYVFEYPLFVQHKGTFNNGITTIQCMYAPEFSAHSEGVRVVVEE
jgi:uncharacterized protein YfaS (alpha-2-macroglobulin family)